MEIDALIVDDQSDVRRLLRFIIEDAEEDVSVTGEAASGAEAITRTEELDPRVVVLDYMMPEMDGVEAAREILARRPDQAVILCTAFLDDALRARADAVGIRCCLSKTEFHRIADALREAAA